MGHLLQLTSRQKEQELLDQHCKNCWKLLQTETVSREQQHNLRKDKDKRMAKKKSDKWIQSEAKALFETTSSMVLLMW
jgi:hypothetical protein